VCNTAFTQPVGNIDSKFNVQVPDALTAFEDANIGANPNAGNYINRLRTRNVR
jgi:hypothetical protein